MEKRLEQLPKLAEEAKKENKKYLAIHRRMVTAQAEPVWIRKKENQLIII